MTEEQTYAKWVCDDHGRERRRYIATDPADAAIKCTCSRDECHRRRLLPFRQHVVEVYRVILRLHEREICAVGAHQWASTLYALRMAASIEDVDANTGIVEDPMTFALCEVAIDYDDAQSEIASKYVAAATIFNFLWQAYEAAVAQVAPDELMRLIKEQRFGERGRRLLEARPDIGARFRGTNDLVNLALLQCRKGGLMDERCQRVTDKYGNNALVAAAELAREFRNFLFHGNDQAPGHEDWGNRVVSRCRIYRFYSVSRLLLYLIQAMNWIEHDGEIERFEYGSDEDAVTACEILERLQFRGPGIWPPLTD
jgi:hypothetical protein